MNFNLCLIQPEANPHGAAFAEVIDGLEASLTALGHSVTRRVNGIEPGSTNIVFGFFFLDTDLAPRLPRDTILFNTEQLLRDANEMARSALWWCQQGFDVWDYSPAGVSHLLSLGVRASFFRLGFHPTLARIPRAPEQDIDVLFYGSVNERRRVVLQALKQHGLNVMAVFGAYGEPRDRLIARAKVVLNLHHYDSKIFEVVRCFYLMANAKAIVSEVDADTHMDDAYRPGLCAVPYGSLVDACARLVSDTPARLALEEQALKTIRCVDQTQSVARLLAERAARGQ